VQVENGVTVNNVSHSANLLKSWTATFRRMICKFQYHSDHILDRYQIKT